MTKTTKIGLVAVGAVAAVGIVLGGAALANAATGTPSAAASGAADGHGGNGNGAADTPVTGDELAKVTAAVKAKDSSISVTSVRKDPDGSYDVFGTKDGNQVMYDVSADLSTFTQNAGHGGGMGGGKGPGKGGGASADTPVTGDELARVTAAVKAKDSSISVASVRKDPDGSYDVLGTKDGAQVMYDVSADLSTFTQNTAPTR